MTAFPASESHSPDESPWSSELPFLGWERDNKQARKMRDKKDSEGKNLSRVKEIQRRGFYMGWLEKISLI